MSPQDCSLQDGYVEFWDLWDLNPEIPMGEQPLHLKEDLALVRYRDGRLLDVGWYPEGDIEGTFVVVVVEEHDWESPIYRAEPSGVQDLLRSIGEAAQVAASHQSTTRP